MQSFKSMSKQWTWETFFTELDLKANIYDLLDHERIKSSLNSSLHDLYSQNTEAFRIDKHY